MRGKLWRLWCALLDVCPECKYTYPYHRIKPTRCGEIARAWVRRREFINTNLGLDLKCHSKVI